VGSYLLGKGYFVRERMFVGEGYLVGRGSFVGRRVILLGLFCWGGVILLGRGLLKLFCCGILLGRGFCWGGYCWGGLFCWEAVILLGRGYFGRGYFIWGYFIGEWIFFGEKKKSGVWVSLHVLPPAGSFVPM